jgi:hypothetical protein
MDDSLCVSGREPIRQLCAQCQDLLFRHGPGCHTIPERRPFDVLRHQKIDLAIGIEVVHGLDVGVIQRRQSQRFVAEAPPGAIVGQQAGRQDLESHVALEALITRAVDDSHAALADASGDAIACNRPPNHGDHTQPP